MKRFLSPILLLMITGLVHGAFAQVDVLPTEKAGDKSKELTLPDPMALDPDWWRYLEVDPKNRRQRIDQIVAQLRKRVENLPAEYRADGGSLMERAIGNLDAYSEGPKSQPPEPVARQPFAESYSLEKWLGITRKLRFAEGEIESDQEAMLRKKKRIRAMRNHFDTMTANYLALPENSGEKALAGLDLIGYWAGIAILESRQEANRQNLIVLTDAAKHLAEEAKIAGSRLRATKKVIPQFDRKIEKTLRAIDAIHGELAHIEGVRYITGSDSALAKAGNQLQEQKLVDAGVREALEMVTLIRLQNLRDIAILLTDESAAERLDQIRDAQRQRQRDAEMIADRVVQWREACGREQALAGEALAAIVGSSEEDGNKLRKIHSARLELVHKTLLSLQRIDDELDDVTTTDERLNHELVTAKGLFWDWSERSRSSLKSLVSMGTDWFSQSLFKIGETPVTTLGLLRVALIVTIAWWLSALIRRGLRRIRDSGKVANTAFLYTFERLLHYFLITFGIIIGLSSIGVDFTNLALIAGALGVGIGFGLQTIVSNFVSGLILLFERSLRVGDFVELDSGVTGEVKEINVRSTLVMTNDNVDVLVPNSEFIGGKMINWTLTDSVRRIHVPFGVAYGSNKDTVREAALEAAAKVPWSLKNPRKDRSPQVWLVGFGDSSLNFELVVWVTPEAVKRPQTVQAAYLWEVDTALARHQIEIPFPQRDVHLRSGFERLLKKPGGS
ncbi:MAG: mechanosensitive ion channel domain-containing protein [Gammaproteobacteria bacterium]